MGVQSVYSANMLFAILLVALAVAARAADVRMEPSVNVFSSSKWLKEKQSIENDVIQTTFVLKHDKSATTEFERTLLDISNPKSPNYGKWLKVLLSDFFSMKIFNVLHRGVSLWP